MHPQPMIAVRDVAASSRWCQRVLGCASGHGGDEYDPLVLEGRLRLHLHTWDRHEYPPMGDPVRPAGNGMLLWFETGAFDAAVQRATEVRAQAPKLPAMNPLAQHREIWLRDPDGCTVVIASPHGDLGPPP